MHIRVLHMYACSSYAHETALMLIWVFYSDKLCSSCIVTRSCFCNIIWKDFWKAVQTMQAACDKQPWAEHKHPMQGLLNGISQCFNIGNVRFSSAQKASHSYKVVVSHMQTFQNFSVEFTKLATFYHFMNVTSCFTKNKFCSQKKI